MVLFGCVLSVGLAASAGAVEVGERIGPLELTTLEGPKFVMDNYDKRVGTVIAFLSSRCPVTDRMAERINYIQEEYRHDDILWVGIGANPAESGDELRDFCQKRGMIFPFYQDPQGKIRKRFAPKVTPEVFLLNANSEVVYHGAIGDSEDVALEAAAMGRCLSNGRALPVRVIGRCIPVIPFKTNWREAKGCPASYNTHQTIRKNNRGLCCLYQHRPRTSANSLAILYLSLVATPIMAATTAF